MQVQRHDIAPPSAIRRRMEAFRPPIEPAFAPIDPKMKVVTSRGYHPCCGISEDGLPGPRSGIPHPLWRGLPHGETFTHAAGGAAGDGRSEEHTSELQSLMRISYA